MYNSIMAMPGPEFIAPMVAYLATDAAKDVNNQVFHVEKGKIHTYAEPVEARALCKFESDGMFSVDELVQAIPGSLMAGIPNIAPLQADKE